MSIVLKKFVREEGSELNDLGTVAALAGKGGKIEINPKNFNNPAKRVAIIVSNKKGESAVVACSDQVSRGLRAKNITLSQVTQLSILETADGKAFISMPGVEGSTNVGIEVDSVNAAKLEPVQALSAQALEDLIAF